MSLSKILEVLCVLAIRFRQTYIHTSEMNWHRHFDIDISFIKGLFDSTSPVDIACTLTNADLDAFSNLSPENIIKEDGVARQYLTRWHLLSRSIWECCSALPDRIGLIQECVQVSIINPF